MRKSVKFRASADQEGGDTWQNEEIKKLESKIADLIVENESFKTKL